MMDLHRFFIAQNQKKLLQIFLILKREIEVMEAFLKKTPITTRRFT